ncbi:MAG: hypothetical protein WCG47_20540 [Dermatophilaceae bacterium]
MGPERVDVEDLVRRAERQEVLAGTDSKTAAPMLRILVEGQWYIVKHLSHELDWLARAAGDIGCNAYLAWERGLYAALPPEIDAAVVGARRDGPGAILVMHEVGDLLVPAGDDPVPHEQHRRFIAHMAAMHAHFAGARATAYDLTPLPMKYTMLSELTARVEADLGHEGGVPGILATAWPWLRAVAPEAGAVATGLAADPWPLVSAFEGTPTTLSHGDWKYGNLGSHPDGRTILLDWAVPGVAPFCATSRTTWPSTAAALPSPRRPPSTPTARSSSDAASRRWGGSSASSSWSSSGRSSSSGGRRRTSRTSWAGGSSASCRPRGPCRGGVGGGGGPPKLLTVGGRAVTRLATGSCSKRRSHSAC